MNEYLDLIGDTTLTSGTGKVTPTGERQLGSRPFSTHTAGATVTYRIANTDLSEFEVGKGLWDGTTLDRTTVYVSSNGNSLVNFGAGYKHLSTVFSAMDYVKTIAAIPIIHAFVFGTLASEWVVKHNQGTLSYIAYIKDESGVPMLAATETISPNEFIVHLSCAMTGRVDVLFGAD